MSTRSGDPNDRGATREDTLGKEIRLDEGRGHDDDRSRGDRGDDLRHDSSQDTHVVRDTDVRRDRDVRRDDHVVERHEMRDDGGYGMDRARGGFSFWSVLSGMFVAIGAFVLLAALIGGILAAAGIADGGIQAGELTTAGIAAGVAIVITQFLAYMWGGYTAGRMARGSGILNGIMVPIFALLIVLIIGGIGAATGASADAAASGVESALPLPLSDIAQFGTALGIAALVAMLLGGALGGRLGHRWHRKLEDGDTRYTDGRDARHTS